MKKAYFHVRGRRTGFTLLEVMITLAVAGILLVGLSRLYQLTVRSYSLQEQLTEMNQNAKFVMKEMTDIISQAGSDCAAINSDSLDKDTIIKISGSAPYADFTLKINSRGGLYVVSQPCTVKVVGAKCSLQVDNAAKFRYAKYLGKLPNPATSLTRSIRIYKLDSVHTKNNYIFVSGGAYKDTFLINDAFYSFDNHRFYLNGTDFCMDSASNVLAENIDSLKVFFYTITGAAATNWQTMRSACIVVESTTSMADYRYPGDGKRRLKLSYNFRLKNKV